MDSLPGYHLTEIKKGINGTVSKIEEEIFELVDALDQKAKIMALIELSDLVGAIELYCKKEEINFYLPFFADIDVLYEVNIPDFLEITRLLNISETKDQKLELTKKLINLIDVYTINNFKGLDIKDLVIMKDITKRAFENGRR